MNILNYGEESVAVAFEEVKFRDWAEKVYRPDIQGKWDKLYNFAGAYFGRAWRGRFRSSSKATVESRIGFPLERNVPIRQSEESGGVTL
jgi:hypothetical protein